MPYVGASGLESAVLPSGVCATTGLQAATATRPRNKRIGDQSNRNHGRASLQIVLDGLFVTPAVTAIAEALTSAHIEGKLAVIGNAKLAAALGSKHDVLPIGLSPRAAKRLTNALADLS